MPLAYFFNVTAPTKIYTLSLHDALPISTAAIRCSWCPGATSSRNRAVTGGTITWSSTRSEEHTSELQSQSNLVCRLLLEKKKRSASVARHTNIHSMHGHSRLPCHTGLTF